MYPKIYTCEQGTEEWFNVRLGKISASHFSDVMAQGKGKTRLDYMMKLVAEKLTGEKSENYSNGFMEWGVEYESQARDYYAELSGIEVEQVGFIESEEDVGCSPDGLVGEYGLIEIKCPKSTTHIQTILDNKMQTCYTAQVQGQLWVTGRKWCDWISYDPRVKGHEFFVTRIPRDEAYIAKIADAVKLFKAEMSDLIKQIEDSIF